MALFDLIVSDPSYEFSDKLTMSETKRGAESNYQGVLSFEDIKNLKVKEISQKDAFLALWCPSALIPQGLEIMKSWGFEYKQTHIWVKIKVETSIIKLIKQWVTSFNIMDINDILSFKMGHWFRQTHEVVLIGVRGKISKELKNKSQRSVHLYPPMKHSKKPEILQNMLEKMFPNPNLKKLEMFSRRERSGWICTGNDNNLKNPEDIRVFIERNINENTSS